MITQFSDFLLIITGISAAIIIMNLATLIKTYLAKRDAEKRLAEINLNIEKIKTDLLTEKAEILKKIEGLKKEK